MLGKKTIDFIDSTSIGHYTKNDGFLGSQVNADLVDYLFIHTRSPGFFKILIQYNKIACYYSTHVVLCSGPLIPQDGSLNPPPAEGDIRPLRPLTTVLCIYDPFCSDFGAALGRLEPTRLV